MEGNKIKCLDDLMSFIWNHEYDNPAEIDRIIEQNGWVNLHGEEGAICHDGKHVLIEINGCSGYDILMEPWGEYDDECEEDIDDDEL